MSAAEKTVWPQEEGACHAARGRLRKLEGPPGGSGIGRQTRTRAYIVVSAGGTCHTSKEVYDWLLGIISAGSGV